MKRRYLGEDAQARFDEARFEAIRRLGALAREHACECVVVAGDVFESNAVDRRTVARALEAFDAIRVPVYLLPGNHDPIDGASIFSSPVFTERAPAHVRVVSDATPIEVRPGLEIVGAPWRTKRPDDDELVAAIRELPPTRTTTRIALGHGAVDTLSPDRKDPARIHLTDVEEALAEGRVHYVALGDRHSTTSVGGSGRVWYSGAPEPTDFDEVEPGFALVVDVDPQQIEVTPHRVGTWHFERRTRIPLDSPSDLDALEAWLTGLPNKPRTLVRIDYEGSLDLQGRARLDALLERGRDLFACLDVWVADCDLAVVPADADFADLELSGFAARAVERLRAEAAGGEAEAHDALALLVRLAGAESPG
jgi:DNA repair exonuclease SbcCD nuclease subunit